MINKEILQQRTQELAEHWKPSCATNLFEKGEKVFEDYIGYANNEKGIKTTADTTYCFSSLTPNLISLCALQLIERGKLSFGDPLSKYVPEYSHAEEITVKHLLDGNSGIPDYFSGVQVKELEKEPNYSTMPFEEKLVNEKVLYAKGLPFGEFLSLINDKPLEFEPGIREIDPSCSERVFLAEIVCRISGKSIFEYEKENIFLPLGMTNTVEGFHANSTSCTYWQSINKVTLPGVDSLYAVTTNLADVSKLSGAIIQKKLLSAKYWKIAAKFNKWGESYCFMSTSGWHCMFLEDMLGFALVLFSKKKRGHYGVMAINDAGPDEIIDQLWHEFFDEYFDALNEATTYPTDAKVVPINNKNVYGTARLSVAPGQENFVWAPPIAIACSSFRKYNSMFVLQDCGVNIGLLILEANKKEDEYYVSTVMIDKRFQHRGYGKIMVAWGVEWLKNKGAKELSIGVNRHNVAARKLYESLGFRAANVYSEGVYMKMEL